MADAIIDAITLTVMSLPKLLIAEGILNAGRCCERVVVVRSAVSELRGGTKDVACRNV